MYSLFTIHDLRFSGFCDSLFTIYHLPPQMIYLDNNATTRVAPEVFDAMRPYLTDVYGNPSSAHSLGRRMKSAVELAREQVAELLGAADPGEIVFTSCGSEADNWAIGGFLEQNPTRRHIITTRVEHEAVRNLCEHLAEIGCEVTWLEVDGNGELNLDGVQAVGKIPINLKELDVDLFALSGHKLHAPQGVGALYIRSGVKLPPFIIGGGQEGGRRAGTSAVPNIAALGAACELARKFAEHERIEKLRNKLEDKILGTIPNARLNGTPDRTKRLPNTANISFEYVEGENILLHLDKAGICVSTGSACHSTTKESSPTLRAMNVPYTAAQGSIRFSLGRYNTEEEINHTLAILPEIIGKLVEMSPYDKELKALYAARGSA